MEQEAAALTADILPWFAQAAPVESVWSAERCHAISQRRALLLDQRLFFDELLSFASIDTHLYPPQSSDQLAALLTAIFGATDLDYLKQLSLVYYLVLDLDAHLEAQQLDDMDELPEQVSKAQQFANTYVVLPNFCSAMQGYWLLDKDEYHDAVPLLSVADFIPKIIRTLFWPSSSTRARTEVERAKLLLRFLHVSTYPTSSPAGSEPHMQEIEMHIQALCFVSGPMRAFTEIRALTSSIDNDEGQRVAVRARLIFKVLEHCFAPPRAAAIHNLLACSLDPEEEVALESFVLSPPPAMTATWSYIAADVLIIRYIDQGRYMDAVGLDRRLGPDVSQGHTTAKDAQQRSKMVEQRKRMIAGAREILPEVQKEILRIEESAELSGAAQEQQEVKPLQEETVFSKLLTPLSASPATRKSSAHQTPTTQAAILSAVVRASASPSTHSTPRKAEISFARENTPASAKQPTAMIGFLAQHAREQQSSASQQGSADDAMDEIDGSAVLVPSAADVAEEAPTAKPPSAGASPWRNTPTLTSTSPFSGLPKIPKPAFGATASPYRHSPQTTASPFATSSNRSLSGSPSIGARLPGAIGLVSQHGQRSRLGARQASHDDNMEDDERSEPADEPADDTFVGQTDPRVRANKAEVVQIGRLIPGRRDWNESNETAKDEEIQDSAETLLGPPTKRRTRKTPSTPAKTGKMTRSHTGANLSQDAAGTPGSKMTKSRSDASLAAANKRATRSTVSGTRKPLTLSNLEQHFQDQTEPVPPGPIARRTRAATAERESVNGANANDAASTIYTISEAGDGATVTPAKRRTRKTTAATPTSVRRSNRLTSIEPESRTGAPEMSEVASPAKRRVTAGRKSKMPGSLD